MLTILLQDFIRESDLDIYDRVKHSGFWRLIQVRTQQSGECEFHNINLEKRFICIYFLFSLAMIIIQVNPTGFEVNLRAKAREALLEKFQILRDNGTLDVTTILWQECDG